MFLASHRNKAKFRDTSQGPGCDIWTARIVAEVLGELQFLPVSPFQSGLDRCPGNTDLCMDYTPEAEPGAVSSEFLQAWTLRPERNSEMLRVLPRDVFHNQSAGCDGSE